MDEPVAVYEGSGTANKNWLYAGHLGSVIATADAAGNATSTLSYGPFGEPNQATGVRLRYTGQQLLGQLNLYYYKARFYSPALGRFLQTDPIGYADDLNLYAYVGNNPVNRVDPLGLEAEHPGAGLSMGSAFQDAPLQLAVMTPLDMVDARHTRLEGGGGGGGGFVGQAAGGAAKGATHSLDDLSRAASAVDKGGFTKAGRSLQKHGSRDGSKWKQTDIDVNKPAQANPRGQDLVDDVLTSPGGRVVSNPRGGVDAIAPDGRVVRYNRDGTMQGLRE